MCVKTCTFVHVTVYINACALYNKIFLKSSAFYTKLKISIYNLNKPRLRYLSNIHSDHWMQFISKFLITQTKCSLLIQILCSV